MNLADAIKNKDEYKSKAKKLGANPSFIALVKSYLETRKKFYPFEARIKRNPLVGFHPSGLHDACPRQIAFGFIWECQLDENKQVYRHIYKKQVIDEELYSLVHNVNNPKMESIWDFGHLIHFWIQYSVLPDLGIEHSVEVDVEDLYDIYLIAGTADIVVVLQDGRKYLVDIKTAKKSAFYSYNTKEDVPIYYKKQLKLYMKGLGIKYALIYFVCKDDSEMKEFIFNYDEIDITKELEIAKQGKQFLLDKKVPLILEDCKKKKGETYRRCQFSSICFQCRERGDLLKLTNAKNGLELLSYGKDKKQVKNQVIKKGKEATAKRRTIKLKKR